MHIQRILILLLLPLLLGANNHTAVPIHDPIGTPFGSVTGVPFVDVGGGGPPPAAVNLTDADLTDYDVGNDMDDSDGTPYTVSNTLTDSDGTPYST